MNIFKILFLEDYVPDIRRVERGLKMLENVECIHHDRWDLAKEVLENEHFDLVIADLYIYKDADEAKNKDIAGLFPCLGELIEIVGKQMPDIPVVVYTGRETLNALRKYWDKICDFWDKQQIDSEFLSFRIRKIREMIESERPASLLIKHMRASINNQGQSNLPWEPSINDLLTEYEQYGYSLDQARCILPSLRRIAGDLGFPNSFEKGFNVCLDIDTPLSSLLSIRPHLHHSIITFLLGYYLFNLSSIKWKEILNSDNTFFRNIVSVEMHDMSEEGAIEVAWGKINSIWFTASLLHDVGLVIAKHKTMEEKLTDLIDKLDITMPINTDNLEVDNEKRDDALIRIGQAPSKEEIINFIRQLDYTDHGLTSSIFLAKHCYDEVPDNRKNEISIAAEAVALHNSLSKNGFPLLDFQKEPIAAMLVFCDSIQSWKRDMPDPSILDGDYIAKVELCDLKTISRHQSGPEVSFVVRYYPHAQVARHKPTFDKIYCELSRILELQVKAPLTQKLSFPSPTEYKPRIKVIFQLGHKEITTLEIS